MSCTKNPQKFFWINYNGGHNWKLTGLRKFMKYVGNNFMTLWECENCRLEEERHFTTQDELIAEGVSISTMKHAEGVSLGWVLPYKAWKKND